MGEKTGPKSKYRSDLGDIIIEIAKQGGHQAQMFIALGEATGTNRPISSDTFAKWRKRYEEFEEAYQCALVYSKAFYENLILRGGCGLIPGYKETSIFYTMNNKFPDEYKRGTSGANTESPTTTINIVQMSPEDLRYKIAQKQELLKQKGQLIEVTHDNDN